MAKSQNLKNNQRALGQQKSKNKVEKNKNSNGKKQDFSPKKLWKKVENVIFFNKPTKMKKIVFFLVIVVVGVIVFLLKRFNVSKEGLVLPPPSLEDLVNIRTNQRNNFNIYNSAQDYVVNSCNWIKKGTNGNFGTSPKNTAGNVGTNFTFSYPNGLKEGAQIRNEQGHCLDTNKWYPGNNKSIISESWWWNPKCYSPTNPNKLLQKGQVGFKINKNKQLEFNKGNCLNLGVPNRFGDCKFNQNNPRCKFDIIPSPNISFKKRECPK